MKVYSRKKVVFVLQVNKKEKEYIEKKEAIKEEASNIVAHYGFDSAEYEECRRRYEALGENPVSMGEKCAYGALSNTRYWNSSEFEMSGFLWKQDIHDFVTALRKAGIKTFAFTNQSTAVMADMLTRCDLIFEDSEKHYRYVHECCRRSKTLVNLINQREAEGYKLVFHIMSDLATRHELFFEKEQ